MIQQNDEGDLLRKVVGAGAFVNEVGLLHLSTETKLVSLITKEHCILATLAPKDYRTVLKEHNQYTLTMEIAKVYSDAER